MSLTNPYALTPAEKQKLLSRGLARERVTFPSKVQQEQKELASREAYRSKPVVQAYNKLYSAFRRKNGRTPGPVEIEQIWKAARQTV